MMRLDCRLIVGLLVAATAAAAQSPPDSTPKAAATRAVTPGARYRAGWLHRALLGNHYRDLWATPIDVEVLDLETYGGGLHPTRRGGGQQTKSLRFEGNDGRKYAFRSIDKDPSPLLPPELRATLVDRIFQDQISASHPAGALVVPALLEAVGVAHAPPRLFVMPDAAALGQYRHDFAGVLGTLEERPTETSDESPGFEGARKVADTEELFRRLDENPDEAVDAQAFLAARLMDLYLGDWDRHAGQWRWIKVGEGKRSPWIPVPYDRDQAFVRLDGFLLDIARMSYPQLVNFGDDYPSIFGLGWNARLLDRRLLVGLEWPIWDSVATELRARLTDSVIDMAVRRLPPQYYAKDGERMSRALRSRRDKLPDAAHRLYRLLAREVDVRATAADEIALATRSADGALELVLSRRYRADGTPRAPYFHRRFSPDETKDVRLFLGGGVDSVSVQGSGGGPTLRVIGGGGGDGGSTVVSDASSGPIRFYDTDPASRGVGPHRVAIDRRPYAVPDSTSHIRPAPRDWGHMWRFQPWLSYSADVGTFFGYGAALYRYGFRKDPYGSSVRFRAGYATGADAFRFDVSGDFRRENSGTHLLVFARASGIEVIRFFGFGNATPLTQPSEFYKVRQEQYLFAPALAWLMGRHWEATTGPLLKYAATDENPATLLDQVRPYGFGNFGQIGAQATLSFDSRDRPIASTRGLHLAAGGSVYPGIWDVVSTFGEIHGEASTYLTPPRFPLQPTLALRVGGKRVWGEYPFHEAAFVGGSTTVRGIETHRYIGDASLYANAELRLRLTRFFLVLPGEVGVFGLSDAGRVFLSGQSSDKWHTAVGGGLWFAFLSRASTISLAVADGEDRTGFYLRAGFLF
jgi:hypothetical protein